MLVESEPNDTVLEADGPVPGSGFLSTRSTSNDHDRFVLRLQPQRQVTLTLTRISGCRASTDFGLDRTDGYEEISLGNQFREVYTKSWTTPVVPVEYIGDLYGDSDSPTNQCTTSVVVSPADAVIEGPLPARAPQRGGRPRRRRRREGLHRHGHRQRLRRRHPLLVDQQLRDDLRRHRLRRRRDTRSRQARTAFPSPCPASTPAR